MSLKSQNTSRLARLPRWISFWLGYRDTPPPQQPGYIIWFWSFIGAFTGISIIQAIFGHVPYFISKGVPSIVGGPAFPTQSVENGATAVLIYGAIESPLAQPRPVMGGHLLSAMVGICITKLFLLLPTAERFDELTWLAGSLACSISLVLMQMTGTTHPPAGATALLAAINPDIRSIGWFYVPVVLMASSIALIVALFTNNMQRRYPTYWWTPPHDMQRESIIFVASNSGNLNNNNNNDNMPRNLRFEEREKTLTNPEHEDHGLFKFAVPESLARWAEGVGAGLGFSEPNTPTDSTVVSRRQSLSLCRCVVSIDQALDLERGLAKGLGMGCSGSGSGSDNVIDDLNGALPKSGSVKETDLEPECGAELDVKDSKPHITPGDHNV
ncbi:HPP-domain-containing protein [Coprinopsis marcescibilis]|uniref:HPP-domain-containing protein n=1 Tax=Coprinopsis marcescibilis TaxID=230819 RepID=A0A5C3KM02_COPMA|nr:HPP-domain-containing protein [Coprinopsis marcescibilis]